MVTKGSSSGIGAVVAMHFARLGANVVVTGRDDYRTLKVAQQCRRVATRGAEVCLSANQLLLKCIFQYK